MRSPLVLAACVRSPRWTPARIGTEQEQFSCYLGNLKIVICVYDSKIQKSLVVLTEMPSAPIIGKEITSNRHLESHKLDEPPGARSNKHDTALSMENNDDMESKIPGVWGWGFSSENLQ
ncbi:hypothetical protein TNCV_1581381 [Trichonephila clavipes]|nr:hypothetical protein TNCV_1581381 [Trichonephila clavipes]